MTTRYFRYVAAMFMLTLAATTVQAEDTRVQQLERTLQERDKVITELLERVEALERQVGVQPRPADSGTPPERDTGSSGEADLPQEPGHTPGVVVVEEGAAERALERSLAREGALLLPSGVLEIEPGFTYARQEDAAPRLLASGSDLFAGEIERNIDSLTASLGVRLGLPGDSQLEVGVPYRWRETESVTSVDFAATEVSKRSGTGFGDTRIGLSKTLLREGLWRPDLTGRLTWDTDTGETDDGVSLGGRFHELQGSLTAIKRQDPVVFVGGVSYDHTFREGRLRPGSVIAANFGNFIALSPETSLQFLLSVAHQDEADLSGTDIEGSDRLAGSFVVGGSTLLAPGTLLNLSLGIGLTEDADDLSISLSLPIRLKEPLF